MAKKKNKERASRGTGSGGPSAGAEARGREADPARVPATEEDLGFLRARLAAGAPARLLAPGARERLLSASAEAACYVLEEGDWLTSPEGVASLVLQGELRCLSLDGRHRHGVCLAGTFPEFLARRLDGEPARALWYAERRTRILEIALQGQTPWRRRDAEMESAALPGSAAVDPSTLARPPRPVVDTSLPPAEAGSTVHRNTNEGARENVGDDTSGDDTPGDDTSDDDTPDDDTPRAPRRTPDGREADGDDDAGAPAGRATAILRDILRTLVALVRASGVGRSRRKVRAMLLAAVLSALFLVLLPLYSRYLVDVVILRGELSKAPWVVGGMVLTGALGLACALVRDRFIAWLLGSFQLLTLVAFACRVHGLPLTGLWARGEGRILQLHEEARQLFEQMAGRVVTLLIGGVQFSLQLLIVALIDVRFLFITLALLAAAGALVAVVSRAASHLSARQRFAEEKRVQLMHEQLEAQEWIHSTRSLAQAFTGWEHACYEASRASSRVAFLHALLQHAGAFAQRAVGAFLLFLGLYFHQRGELTLGQVVALAFVSDQALKPALQWLRDWRYLVETPVTLARVAHFLAQGDPVGAAGGEDPAALEAGESRGARAWTGPFDAGTAPVQIVACPSVGLREGLAYELAFAGEGACYVSSEVPIFSGSLLDNVALGAEEPDSQRAVAALRVCELGSLVEGRVRGGLEASLKGVAGMLTERERIQLALARCVYFGKGRIVIDGAFDDFDTPTWQRLSARMRLAVDGLSLCIFTATEPPPAALAGAGFHRASPSRRGPRPEREGP